METSWKGGPTSGNHGVGSVVAGDPTRAQTWIISFQGSILSFMQYTLW